MLVLLVLYRLANYYSSVKIKKECVFSCEVPTFQSIVIMPQIQDQFSVVRYYVTSNLTNCLIYCFLLWQKPSRHSYTSTNKRIFINHLLWTAQIKTDRSILMVYMSIPIGATNTALHTVTPKKLMNMDYGLRLRSTKLLDPP